MDKVILFGHGQTASVVYSYLTYDSPYEVVAFTVDREEIERDRLFELPIVPFEGIESIYPPDEYRMLVAVGYVQVNKLRAERYHQAKELGYELITYVSSKAATWPGLIIGDNCIISEYAVIQPFAEIGNNVIIGSHATIAHHTVIKDHCFVTAGAVLLGNVTVEPYCFLGGHSTIRNNLIIGRGSVIGAGAVILKNTHEGGVYMGKHAELLPISSDNLRKI